MLSDDQLDAIALQTFEGMPDNTPRWLIRRVMQRAVATAAVQDVQFTTTVLEPAPIDRDGLARAMYDAEGHHAADSWETETQMMRDNYLRLADAVIAFQTAPTAQEVTDGTL